MAGSSYRPTQGQIDAWLKGRVSQEAEAQKATTLQELAKYFNGSQYARDTIKSANREAYNILSKIEDSLVNRDPPRDMNQQVAKATMLLGGYTTQQADQLIAQDKANVRASRTASAGISARGVQQNFNNPIFTTKPTTPQSALNFFNNSSTSTSMSSLGVNNPALYSDKSLMGSTAKATSTDRATAQANADQTAYVNALRSGGVSIAEALLNPRTTQTYYVKGEEVPKSKTSINLETFLTERGYDITKPETIPDSVFKAEKQTQARAQASSGGTMGDLRNFANTYPTETKAVQQARQEIKDFFGVKPYQSPSPSSFMGGGSVQGLERPPAMPKSEPLSPLGFFAPPTPPSRTMPMGSIQYVFGVPTSTKASVSTLGMGGGSSNGSITDRLLGTELGDSIIYRKTGDPFTDFFASSSRGIKNTVRSNFNFLENLGNFVSGKPQIELRQPPVQDDFFGALSAEVQNRVYGTRQNSDGTLRPADPLGDFFKSWGERDKTQAGAEIFTEALSYAIPVEPALKGIGKAGEFVGKTFGKPISGFFDNTVKGVTDFFGGSAKASSQAQTASATAQGLSDSFNFFGNNPKTPRTPTPTTDRLTRDELFQIQQRMDTSLFLTAEQKQIVIEALKNYKKTKDETILPLRSLFSGVLGSLNKTPTPTPKPRSNNAFNSKPTTPKQNPVNDFFDTNPKPKPTTPKQSPVNDFFNPKPKTTTPKPKGNLPTTPKTPKPTNGLPVTPKPTKGKIRVKDNPVIIKDFFDLPVRPKGGSPPVVPDFFRPPKVPDTGLPVRPKTPDGGGAIRPIDTSFPVNPTRPTYPTRPTPDTGNPRNRFGLPFGLPSLGGGGGGFFGGGGRGLRYGNRINTAWNVNPDKVLGFFKGADFKQSYGGQAFWDLDRKTLADRKKSKKKKSDPVADFFKL